MEYIKIKKVLEQITKEEEKNELKRIKNTVKTNFAVCGDFTEITTKDGEKRFLTKKLTLLQQQKTLAEQKQILSNNTQKTHKKLLDSYFNKLDAISNADVIENFSISVDWSKGGVYGRQASAELREQTKNNYSYYESSKTSGCGYDKRSTATACVLNQSKPILKLILNKLEKQPQKTIRKYLTNYDCRDFLGYGLYLKYLSFFQGGVGFSSHENILNNLGFKTVTRHETKNSDYYFFEYKPSNKKRGGK